MASARRANSLSVAHEMATHLPSLVEKWPCGRGEVVVRRAVAFAHLAVHGVRRGQFVGAAKHRLVQRRVHVLPFAGTVAVAQRHHHADAAVEPGHVVAQRRRARRDRRAARHAGQVGDAAHGVGDAGEAGAVLVRAGLAVAGDAQHHQARVDGCSTSQPRPHFSSVPVRKFSHSTSVFGDQLLEHRDAVGGAQVERDRTLVARLAQPGERVAAARRRAEAPQGVAAVGVFDLQHVGAELAQQGGAKGRRDDGGDIDDAHAGQRQIIGRWAAHGRAFVPSYCALVGFVFGTALRSGAEVR
jgi:hypothetical protein